MTEAADETTPPINEEVRHQVGELRAITEFGKYTPLPPPLSDNPEDWPRLPIPPETPPAAPKERKIAILGSASSSVGLAPVYDPTWEIWACSPGNKGIARCDVWFELHNVEVKLREGLAEWLDYLKKQPVVYMQAAFPDYPGSKEYPLQAMLEKWGPFWWTSQIAFMLALAIEEQPHAIGIYGVDMAANSEYNQQRLACQYFIQHIVRSPINLVVPPESDILEPAPLYGYCESSRQWRKYYARKLELVQRVNDLKAVAAAKEKEANHLLGALDDMEYQCSHWANRRDFY